ncbi:thioredoxin domain-containing protein [Methanolobus sp. ZRKC2]|uniref:thioredoxin family protein n=1 Tax=Methanolobus sp. ZRKC2 TaxID=3125783 RepID=UPI00324E9C9E
MKRKSLQLILLVALSLLLSGCIDSESPDDVSSQNEAGLIEVSSLEDINQTLINGPVLVEMGYDGCPACVAQKPIMEEIAAEYEGEAATMYVDTRSAGSVAAWFGGDYVPDSFVIVNIEDGQYVYMRADGQMTTDRSAARFVGLTEKEIITETLDQAIEVRQEEEGAPEVQETVGMIEVTSFEGLNQTLLNGPVLVEVGSESCSACNAQKPIMEEIAAEYPQDASVAYVDNRRGNELAVWFGAGYVPDSFVIVDIEDGQYVYMGLDGQTTTDRTNARFLGLTQKDLLTEMLENAIEARQGN